MDIKDAIIKRRSLRSIGGEPFSIEEIEDLANAAALAPSCYNNQPWRFLFITNPQLLNKLRSIYSPGNEWAYDAPMVIAICSEKTLDCVVKNREYYLFDTGLATAFMLLRIEEMGGISHLIAGFNEIKAKEILGIPDSQTLIALMLVGEKMEIPSPRLNEKQLTAEIERPPRHPFSITCKLHS